MLDDQTRRRLDLHAAWLASEGARGERADLRGAVLEGASLAGAQLSRADLRDTHLAGADLAGASLVQADLEAADLSGANLEEADLTSACLRRCRFQGSRMRAVRGLSTALLRDADFSGATGLDGRALAGADLPGVRLPEALSFDGRLSYVAETSQNARPAFLSILLSCVFVTLTVFSTPDSALVANKSLAVLPDLATDIPAASFFWVAPVLLLGLYVYLHLQMSGIGETLAELPAVFPDGTPLEKRAYPWVATNLLRLKCGWQSLRFEEAVAIALLWGSVPLTLIALWARYLPVRDWIVSGLHVFLIAACVWGALRLFEQTTAAVSGGAMRVKQRRAILCGITVILVATTVSVSLAPIVFDINPRRSPFLVLDVRDADLSHAVLRHKDLRYMAARDANFTAADLRDADLLRADVQRTLFTGADLESARFTRTDLDSADFRNACLRKADFRDADMEDADFRGSYLGLTDLRSPLLTRADMRGAILHGTDLQGARLTGARFDGALIDCFALHKTELRPEIKCTNLEGADLQGAHFLGTDLRHAIGLTQVQVDAACGDATTRLPEGLHIASCPPVAEPQENDQPAPQQNPCEHEIRDDRWPQ